MTPAHLARACVEGVLCGLADALDALATSLGDSGGAIRRIVMIGGGARSEAVRRIAPQVFGTEVLVPPAVEAVADGAARQAAWALAGTAAPPSWEIPGVVSYDGDVVPAIRARYGEVRTGILSTDG
jgi:xylulokinase